MQDSFITFDKASARRMDENGFLHVDETNISKATVNPYYGREIPNSDALGLDPNKVYKLLRDPEELKKGAATFNNLPVLDKHIPVSAMDLNNPDIKKHVVGSTGTEAEFVAPYLKNSMVLHTASAIADVQGGSKSELSCAYRYDPVMKGGTYDGEQYDGVMTKIRGNHLALVVEGRAGHDVKVMDAQIAQIVKPAIDYRKISGALGIDTVALGISAAITEDARDAAKGSITIDDDDDDSNGTGREVAEEAAEKAIKLAGVKPTPENRATAAKLCKEAAQAHINEGFPKQGRYYAHLAGLLSYGEDSSITKRDDVSAKAGEKKYGEVAFADMKNKKYPLDTPKHVRSAASYFGMPKNRSEYSKEGQTIIDKRIRAAKKKFNIGTFSDAEGK